MKERVGDRAHTTSYSTLIETICVYLLPLLLRDDNAVLAIGLCLSVCLSQLTSPCSTKTAKRKITQTTPHDSTGTQGL